MSDHIVLQEEEQLPKNTAFNPVDSFPPTTSNVFFLFSITSCIVLLLGFIYCRGMNKKLATADVAKFVGIFGFLIALFFIIYLNVYEY